MNTILDDEGLSFDLKNYKFRGKLAGKSWTHQQALNRIEMARKVIFIFALAIFYPLIINYLITSVFYIDEFVARIAISIFMIMCGLVFIKFRLVGLLLSLLPVSLIVYLNLVYGFTLKQIGFNGAVLIIICMGIYYHFQEVKIRKELIMEIRKGGELVERI